MNTTITLPDLSNTLEGIERRSHSLTPVMTVGAIMAASEVKGGFDRSQGPDGVPWVGLRQGRLSGGQPKPLLDTGVLRASITHRHTDTTLTVGTFHQQAKVHQFGATIVPKKGKWLTIPQTKEAKYAGSPRRFARPLRFEPRGREFGLMMDENDVVQYAAVKKVVIPARPFMGFSGDFLKRFEMVLTQYLLTGKL